MSVLLSIRPKYVNAIMTGVKRYEFRRVVFKRKGIVFIYIYSTSPVNKIVGLCQIEKIIKGSPKEIWNRCCKHAGISKMDFFNYFRSLPVAYALKIKNAQRFHHEINPHSCIHNFRAPQSFYYVPHPLIKEII